MDYIVGHFEDEYYIVSLCSEKQVFVCYAEERIMDENNSYKSFYVENANALKFLGAFFYHFMYSASSIPQHASLLMFLCTDVVTCNFLSSSLVTSSEMIMCCCF